MSTFQDTHNRHIIWEGTHPHTPTLTPAQAGRHTGACAAVALRGAVRILSVGDLQKTAANVVQDFCHHRTHGERSLPRQQH